MRIARARVAATALLLSAAACGADPGAEGPDAGGYDPPSADLVPAVGTAAALDIATWNVENFPALPATPRVLADLITSLDLDIVAMEEIADQAAWDELLARLPHHDGVLSTHTYSNGSFQKVGFVYRAAVVALEDPLLLYPTDSYEFPRPPLEVRARVLAGPNAGLDLRLIAVHLKAGRDASDRDRRRAAMTLLRDHVAALVAGGEPEVVVLGDYNEDLEIGSGRDVFAPFLDDAASYTVLSDALTLAGGVSFLPSEVMLDHLVATAGFVALSPDAPVIIPPLHEQYSAYEAGISDHLPVVISPVVLE